MSPVVPRCRGRIPSTHAHSSVSAKRARACSRWAASSASATHSTSHPHAEEAPWPMHGAPRRAAGPRSRMAAFENGGGGAHDEAQWQGSHRPPQMTWRAGRRGACCVTSYRRNMLCNFLGNHPPDCTPGCVDLVMRPECVWPGALSTRVPRRRGRQRPRSGPIVTRPRAGRARHLVLGGLGLPTEPRPSVCAPPGPAPFAFLAQRNRRRRPGVRPWPRGLAASDTPGP